MDKDELAAISVWLKFFGDLAIDLWMEKRQEGYTPDQLKVMVEDEQIRHSAVNAAWDDMKLKAGI